MRIDWQEPRPQGRIKIETSPFARDEPMNYQAFTNDALAMMYEAVRGALPMIGSAVLERNPDFGVHETPRLEIARI
jgi:hypothetical protein